MRIIWTAMIALAVAACGVERQDDVSSLPSTAEVSSSITDPAADPAGIGACFRTACTKDTAGNELCREVCGGAAICGNATGLCGTGTPCCTLQ